MISASNVIKSNAHSRAKLLILPSFSVQPPTSLVFWFLLGVPVKVDIKNPCGNNGMHKETGNKSKYDVAGMHVALVRVRSHALWKYIYDGARWWCDIFSSREGSMFLGDPLSLCTCCAKHLHNRPCPAPFYLIQNLFSLM